MRSGDDRHIVPVVEVDATVVVHVGAVALDFFGVGHGRFHGPAARQLLEGRRTDQAERSPPLPPHDAPAHWQRCLTDIRLERVADRSPPALRRTPFSRTSCTRRKAWVRLGFAWSSAWPRERAEDFVAALPTGVSQFECDAVDRPRQAARHAHPPLDWLLLQRAAGVSFYEKSPLMRNSGQAWAGWPHQILRSAVRWSAALGTGSLPVQH